MQSAPSRFVIARVLLSHWPRHKLQCVLCLGGILLGVAVVTAMDLANFSALQSFRESIATVSGKATHQIVPVEGAYIEGVPEELFLPVSTVAGVSAAPVIESYGTALPAGENALAHSPAEERAAQLRGRAPQLLRILGIEPLADRAFRSSESIRNDLSGDAFKDWMLRDDGCVLSAAMAGRLGVKTGDSFALIQSGRRHTLKLLGTYDVSGNGEDFLFMDIAAAQERFGRLGRLSSIDLILPDAEAGERAAAGIHTLLPPGMLLQRPSERAAKTEALLSAFQLNLSALSLLALVVGMFLIYNTLTVAVLQRMDMLGTLRCLGASAAGIRTAILAEAAVFGLVGGALGLVGGTLLARLFLSRVGGIVSDLYTHLGTLDVFFDPHAALKGFALGFAAALLGALVPALEAARIAPTQVLRRSTSERGAQRAWLKLLLAAAGCVALAAILSAIPGTSPTPGLAASFALALSGALAAPAVTRAFSLFSGRLLRRIFGEVGLLAARGISANLSRTGLAVGALGMALSMAAGVALMVASFRGTLDKWMLQTLQADVYIRPAGPALLRQKAKLPDEVIAALKALPEAEAVDTFRGRDVELADGSSILVSSTDIRVTFSRGRERFPMTPGSSVDRAYDGLLAGQAVISESLARKQHLSVGDRITLPSARPRTRDGAPAQLTVEGIYYEYATDRGVLSMDVKTFAELFGSADAQSASLYLKPGTDASATIARLRTELGAPRGLYIFSNRSLRDEAFRVFDRTFAITAQLENLSLAVGLCGILSALLALLRERAVDYAVMRALGLTARGLFLLVLMEGVLLGTAAFAVACVLGPALALLLIKVINVRAFGWTILFSMHWEVFARMGVLALAMAAVAALYPAWRGWRMNLAGALREE